MTYAQKLKEYCTTSGYKKDHIAKTVGVTPTYLWKMCTVENIYPSSSVSAMLEIVTNGAVTRAEIERERKEWLTKKAAAKTENTTEQ